MPVKYESRKKSNHQKEGLQLLPLPQTSDACETNHNTEYKEYPDETVGIDRNTLGKTLDLVEEP